eukprot:7894292-Prorocentrum_lima.AAC.1
MSPVALAAPCPCVVAVDWGRGMPLRSGFVAGAVVCGLAVQGVSMAGAVSPTTSCLLYTSPSPRDS